MAEVITMRRYEQERDYWRIRAFLRETFLANDRRERSWQAARFDYWRWHVSENIHHFNLERVIFLWEGNLAAIKAVVTPEDPGEAFLHVHPDARTPELEEEMLLSAEAYLGVDEGDHRSLRVWAHADDDLRQEILARRGYEKQAGAEYQRRRVLTEPLPEASVPEGYTLRGLWGHDDLPARSWASWRAFHPDAPNEDYEGWEWYWNVQRAPLYRRQLDVVVKAPEGEVASFATVWYDDVTRTGYFEPVGTVPEHRGQGIARAVMVEAMRRLKWMGGTLATVAGYSPEANALYSSVVSPDHLLYEPWKKSW